MRIAKKQQRFPPQNPSIFHEIEVKVQVREENIPQVKSGKIMF